MQRKVLYLTILLLCGSLLSQGQAEAAIIGQKAGLHEARHEGGLLARKRRRRKKRRRGKKKRGGKIKIEKQAPVSFPQEKEETMRTRPTEIKLPMVEEKKAAGATLEDKLLDEEIAQLKDIIRTTPEGPAKADLLFRLAERYYEKARSIYYKEMQDYDKKVEAWMKKRETNPNLPEPKIDNRRSQVYTKQAMDIYRIILKRYKNYHRLDEVLFTMGYNLYESGNKSEGVKMYWELIKNFPKSRFVPDAYLAMGEHFFNSNDVFNAKKAYERAMGFKNSKVYTYALYKLGWCDYNLGDYEKAIEKFKKVVELSQREAAAGGAEGKGKLQLRREALQDLVLAYSQIDALDEAEQYWVSQVGKRDAKEYLRKLARTYEKQGKPEMTVKAFRRLLDEYPTDPNCPSFHVAIVRAYSKMNQRGKVEREVNRIIEMYRPGSHWWEVNKGNKLATKRAYAMVESALRDLVTTYHQEAQETNRWDTYNLARKLYSKYMEAFGDSQYAYKLRWYYADVLYKMGDFYGAAQQYAKVVETDPKGPFTAEAAYDAVLCWDKCMELRDKKGVDCRKWKATKTSAKIGKEEERSIKEERIDFDAGLKGAKK
ncbi:MAG: tetratricopeptide repeat protein, partial [Deltaproteobacteria bacterium]